MSNKLISVVLSLILLGASFIFYYEIGYSYGKTSVKCPESIPQTIIKDSLPELTLDNVLREIIKHNIKYPLIVLKQVIWETGWLKCNNCSLDYQNIFGYGWNGKTYHIYNHWTKSIEAYRIWQLKYYKEGDYYQFLEDVGYATDTNYIKNLKSIKI